MLRPTVVIGAAIVGAAALGTLFARRTQPNGNPAATDNPRVNQANLTHSAISRLPRSTPTLPKQNNVIILAAPGGQYFDGKLVQNAVAGLSAQGVCVTLIGDGVTPLTAEDIQRMHAAIITQDKPLLFILATSRPYQHNVEHGLYLDGKTAKSTCEFLEDIKRLHKPVDIISVAGNEQVFARYATDYLPNDSTYFSLSPFHSWYGGIATMLDQLQTANYFHGDLTPQKFLIAYLALNKHLYQEGDDCVQVKLAEYYTDTVQHVSLPIYSRCSMTPLEVASSYVLGQRMDGYTKAMIHELFSRFATTDELNDLIAKIETGKYSDFINNPHYGLVHAISYATFACKRFELDATWHKDIAPIPVTPKQPLTPSMTHQ